MPLHSAEQATIRAFVVTAKRDRFITLLGSRKRRREILEDLNHFADWDERYAHPVPTQSDVAAVLRNAGAPAECRVISDSPDLDGRDMPLDDAVAGSEEYSFASVLCCIPGKLAFYFDEVGAPRNRVLLQRREEAT